MQHNQKLTFSFATHKTEGSLLHFNNFTFNETELFRSYRVSR